MLSSCCEDTVCGMGDTQALGLHTWILSAKPDWQCCAAFMSLALEKTVTQVLALTGAHACCVSCTMFV